MYVQGKIFQFFGFSGMDSQLKSIEFLEFEHLLDEATEPLAIYQLIEVQTGNLDIYMRSLKFFMNPSGFNFEATEMDSILFIGKEETS